MLTSGMEIPSVPSVPRDFSRVGTWLGETVRFISRTVYLGSFDVYISFQVGTTLALETKVI